MQVSRRQFLKCFSASSAAVASAPVVTLENLSAKAATAAITKAPSAYLRLNVIEQAVVSTYAILDAAGSIKMRGGLIDGAPNTAYVLAANTNYMLSEASNPEARAVLLRLLSPQDANGVTEEVISLFTKLRRDRERCGFSDDGEDFCASYLVKVNRAADRLDENRHLSALISPLKPAEDPMAQRVADWCDKIFSGELEQLSGDPLFNALSTLHRMDIGREVPFSPSRQQQLLADLRREGFPAPEETIYGSENAKNLRACELVTCTIEHELLSSRTFHHPPHILAAAKSVLSQLKGYRTFAWEDFYRTSLKNYLRIASRENAERLSAYGVT